MQEYDLSNVDDMTHLAVIRELRLPSSVRFDRKRLREDEKPAPPCSRGAIKFKARAKKKAESPSSKRRKKKKKKTKFHHRPIEEEEE